MDFSKINIREEKEWNSNLAINIAMLSTRGGHSLYLTIRGRTAEQEGIVFKIPAPAQSVIFI